MTCLSLSQASRALRGGAAMMRLSVGGGSLQFLNESAELEMGLGALPQSSTQEHTP